MLCAYAIDERELPALKKIGVKDSKLVPPAKRTALCAELLKQGEAIVVECSAIEITEWMRKGRSLNELEAKAIGEALSKMKGKSTKTIVDSPDPIPSKFAGRILKYYPGKEVIAENKADYNHVVVGAASIVAKTVREERIAEIKREMGEDFGSGYSHDETTIAYLKRNINNPALQKYIRHSWETAKRLKVTQVPLGDWV